MKSFTLTNSNAGDLGMSDLHEELVGLDDAPVFSTVVVDKEKGEQFKLLTTHEGVQLDLGRLTENARIKLCRLFKKETGDDCHAQFSFKAGRRSLIVGLVNKVGDHWQFLLVPSLAGRRGH